MWMRRAAHRDPRRPFRAGPFGRRRWPRPWCRQRPPPRPRRGFRRVQKVVEQRCLLCHGAQVQMKNVRLDSPQEIASHAQAIYQQVVVSRVMPMSNSTGMTDDERALIDTWFRRARPRARPPAGTACCRSRSARAPSILPPSPPCTPTTPRCPTRDLAGWPQSAHARWPGGARIAVQFVLNYEEGGENSVLHGDPAPSSSCPRCSIRPATRTATCPWRASTSMARAPASGASCAVRSGGCR